MFRFHYFGDSALAAVGTREDASVIPNQSCQFSTRPELVLKTVGLKSDVSESARSVKLIRGCFESKGAGSSPCETPPPPDVYSLAVM